jgi:hypothetical protein
VARHEVQFGRSVLSKGFSAIGFDVFAAFSPIAIIPGKDNADKGYI